MNYTNIPAGIGLRKEAALPFSLIKGLSGASKLFRNIPGLKHISKWWNNGKLRVVGDKIMKDPKRYRRVGQKLGLLDDAGRATKVGQGVRRAGVGFTHKIPGAIENAVSWSFEPAKRMGLSGTRWANRVMANPNSGALQRGAAQGIQMFNKFRSAHPWIGFMAADAPLAGALWSMNGEMLGLGGGSGSEEEVAEPTEDVRDYYYSDRGGFNSPYRPRNR